MFNKKRLITAAVLVVATITIVIVVGTVAAIFFLSPSGDTVPIAGATAVGVPNGPVTTKSIGSEGGSIASPDGRVTVNIPRQAVTSPVNFSVQPITNLAHGGIGSGYRLEPSGQKFATPIKVSFKYDTPDFRAYRPETLAVTYQDPTGVWQAFKTVNVDQASKTLTISTTHFTDVTLGSDELVPDKATLRVRETLEVELKCVMPVRSRGTLLLNRLLGRPPDHCWTIDDSSWSANVGTIYRTGPLSAVYQAPAKKPSPNVATIRLVYHYKQESPNTTDVRTSEITIVDRGYRASGESHDLVYSGVICDLAEPFTVNGTGLANFAFKFLPSSPTEGTVSYATTYYPGGVKVVESGSGSYTVRATDTPEARIAVIIDKATATAMGRSIQPSQAGTLVLHLTPADSECHTK